ncbi:cobalt-precorrin 5A hydrolase [Geomonas sp. RF6]|uniref:cobalt-precorrin 5A hydrolase n=1 Tax=Geomonas sp. RF6 TaxID=2897342 RepID=UPI002ED8CDD7
MIAIIAITANGARLGSLLRNGLPESALFVIDKHACPGATPFCERVPALVERLWHQYAGLVFIMATGIVVRSVAPLLKSKECDPAVVVLDDAGRFAVSLLSGHLGGANALAERCAALAGSIPVVTTATDANGLPSFDMLAKEKGWVIDDLSKVKVLNALLLEGKEIAVAGREEEIRSYFGGKGALSFHATVEDACASGASGCLWVTNQTPPPELPTERLLILRPMDLTLGIGCNRGTSAAEIGAVVHQKLSELSLSMKSVGCIATASAKGDEPGLLAFASAAAIPLETFEPHELNAVAVPSPPSEHALVAIGAQGVAEPAAILAAGGGRLLLNKVKSGNVTLAIAVK